MWTCVSKVIIFGLVLTSLLINSASETLAVTQLRNIEQQINLLNGEYSTTSTTDTPTTNSFGLIHFDGSEYDGETVYFEAVARCVSCTGGNQRVSVSLYNDAGVSQSTITTTSSSYTRIRSGSLALPTDDFTVRFRVDADSGTAYLKSVRLIVDQSANPIRNTETQIEIGTPESTANTSAAALVDPKYYLFDADRYDGTVNSYFEATLRTNGNDTSSDYYFSAYDSGGEEWSTNQSNMVDDSTLSFASTAVDGDIQLLTGNSASATDLGEINQVEIRAYGYQTNGADGQVYLRPVYSGSVDGTNQTFTPNQDLGNAGWSSYYDITSDTNAPSTWTWTDIDNLDIDVEFNQGASGTNTAFIASVEIRVTYEDNSIVAYAQLYNRTNSTVVTTVSTSNNDYERVRSSALSTNWDTTNDDEYEVRIYTSNGAHEVDLANAKVIINQTDPDELRKVELVHHYITIDRTQTNTLYTQDTFINQFDPANFTYTNSFKAYLEGTMRTTASVGYLALYNGSEVVDDSVTSEVTTTSTIYERRRSANIAWNNDWPSSATDMTPVLHASPSETVTVSNAVLIIQAEALDPSVSFSVTGVAESQSINGFSTTVTTTPTSIPFGGVGVGVTEYASHELNVVTNAASTGYIVYAVLGSQFQGNYPANNIDPFTGNSASWTVPQTWISPTGTSPNIDSGWFGAQTTDNSVSGWSGDTSNKFGPIDNVTKVPVMSSTSQEVDETQNVSYALEVNLWQTPDIYSTTIIYEVLPIF